MEKYLEQNKPNISSVWRTDELYLKVKGNNKYLFALMDDETRFWIAQQVTDKKNTRDIQLLFKKGKEVAGKKPNMVISDGAPNFHAPILTGYQIYHNYMRPHEGLDGKTPEVCNIKIEENNKWITLIENASNLD